MLFKLQYNYVLLLSLIGNFLICQNNSCTTSIDTISSANYTVRVGQVLCIERLGVFNGTVKLDGGLIQNNGVFKPQLLTIISGTLINSNKIVIVHDIILQSSSVLNTNKNSFIKVLGNLTINGGVLKNSGILNASNQLINNTGVFENKGIINCKVKIFGTNSYTNKGIINYE